MNVIKYTLFALFFVVGTAQVEAQRITRSTFCSTGGTFSTPNAQLRSTFGQCPGCSKISNSAGTTSIYQGFQQPVQTNSIDGEDNNVPCFQSAFAAEVLTSDCGAAYSFEYLGMADAELAEFTWDFGADAFPSTSTDFNPQSIAYSSVGDKIVSLTVSQDTCTETVRMMINVTQTGFGVDPLVTDISCPGEIDGAITLSIGGGSGGYNIVWDDGSTEETRTDLAAGDYIFTVTDVGNCEFINIITITEPDSMMIEGLVTNESTAGAADGTIVLTIEGGAAPYNFLWDDGTIAQNRSNLISGRYDVTVTDMNGCTVTETFNFNTQEGGAGFEVIADDVFTPNNDNMNDTWRVIGIENFPNNELLVYNRWGQLVYSTEGYANDWRGRNNDGEDLQTGAYWYIFQLNDPNDIQLSGVVTLVR